MSRLTSQKRSTTSYRLASFKCQLGRFTLATQSSSVWCVNTQTHTLETAPMTSVCVSEEQFPSHIRHLAGWLMDDSQHFCSQICSSVCVQSTDDLLDVFLSRVFMMLSSSINPATDTFITSLQCWGWILGAVHSVQFNLSLCLQFANTSQTRTTTTTTTETDKKKRPQLLTAKVPQLWGHRSHVPIMPYYIEPGFHTELQQAKTDKIHFVFLKNTVRTRDTHKGDITDIIMVLIQERRK